MAYEAACEFARKKMRAGIPGEMARRAGVAFNQEEEYFLVPYLDEKYLVHFPSGRVEKAGGTGPVSLDDQILLYLYLATASGKPLAGRWISFKELWGGYTYLDAFNRGPVAMLARAFGARPHLLLEAARTIGGEKFDKGDVATTIPVFPRLPLTLILWAGDEEFPPSGTILFDAAANEYLDTEALVGVAVDCVHRLKKIKEGL